MTIRRVMNTDLIVATADMPLHTAAKLLIDHHITGLPVVDAAGHAVGVITEMDFIMAVGEPHRPVRVVGDLMTADPFTIAVDAPLHDVFDCLMTHPFRRVLICDGAALVGLVSRTDLLPIILEDFVAPA